MSIRLSLRYSWRKCHFRRVYSSSTETGQQPRRAPIARDLGGIQIGSSSSHFSRQGHRSNSLLDLKDFKQGTLSERLAARVLQQKRQNAQPEIAIKKHSVTSQSRSRQAGNTKLSPQKDGAYVRPRQQRRTADMHQNHRHPARQGARFKRRSSPVPHEFGGEEVRLNEGEETDAIDDDVDATKTSFQLRRPDPPLAPRKPPLPPSLTTLEQKLYIDTPTHGLVERQGGDYVRYFSAEEWKIARTQSSAPLDVVDYARLALHLNRTVPVTQRQEGMEVVMKYVQKANTITAPP